MSGYSRVGNDGIWTEALANQPLVALEAIASRIHGRNVLSGLALSIGTGLAVNWSAGSLSGLRVVEVAAGSVLIPASSTRYVWIDATGATVLTTTTTHPGGEYVCLGKAVTSGSVVTSVTTENRDEGARYVARDDYRIGVSTVRIDPLAGLVGIGQAPTAGHALSVTGNVAFAGGHARRVADVVAMSGDVTLTSSSANVVELTPTGAARKAILPAVDSGMWFDLINLSSSEAVIVRNPADTQTLMVLSPGERCEVRPVASSGVLAWGVTADGNQFFRAAVTAEGSATAISTNWETVASWTLERGALDAVGRTLSMRLHGTLNRPSGGLSPTVAWRVRLGGVLLCQSYATPYTGLGALTDAAWTLDLIANVWTAGASGGLMTHATLLTPNAGAGNLVPVPLSLPAATSLIGPGSTSVSAAVDLTGALALTLETQLSAATSGTDQRVRGGRVEVTA